MLYCLHCLTLNKVFLLLLLLLLNNSESVYPDTGKVSYFVIWCNNYGSACLKIYSNSHILCKDKAQSHREHSSEWLNQPGLQVFVGHKKESSSII